MIKYSIIIPYHSNKNLFSLCISNLLDYVDLSESEIIIVDNNMDGSQIGDISIKENSRIKIISRHENLMYPRAINLGAQEASGEYLIFCDADTVVTKNFHKPLTTALDNEMVGYASSKLLNIQTRLIQDFGITFSEYNFPHPYLGRAANHFLVNSNHTPLSACAACSSIKRQTFFDMGGFNEKLLNSYSDIDLCLRLADRGLKTVCVSNSLAYHCGSSTEGSGMGNALKQDTKEVFMALHPKIPVQVKQYIDTASDYFLQQYQITKKHYFTMDSSSIGNAPLYVDTVIENLNIRETGRYKKTFPIRDAQNVDYLNFIPYTIRNYKVPILYFVDSFRSFNGNTLWKQCRKNFDDLVVDRHANIELLRNI